MPGMFVVPCVPSCVRIAMMPVMVMMVHSDVLFAMGAVKPGLPPLTADELGSR